MIYYNKMEEFKIEPKMPYELKFKFDVSANDKNKDHKKNYALHKLSAFQRVYRNNQKWRKKNPEKIAEYNKVYYKKSVTEKKKCECGRMVCPRNMNRHKKSQYHIFRTKYVMLED